MTQYKVWTQDVNGTWVKYEGTSKEEFDATVAKLEDYNNQCLASKSAFARKLYREYFTSTIEDEVVEEVAEEEEVTESVENLEVVTKFFSEGEVDVMKSVISTIKVEVNSFPFSVKNIFDALYKANPNDEYLDFGTVRRAVVAQSTPAVALIKEISDGLYVRR